MTWILGLYGFSSLQGPICMQAYTHKFTKHSFLILLGIGNSLHVCVCCACVCVCVWPLSRFPALQTASTGWREWIEGALIITCVGDFDCLWNGCLNSDMGTVGVKNACSEAMLPMFEVWLCQAQAMQATSPLCNSSFLFPAVLIYLIISIT